MLGRPEPLVAALVLLGAAYAVILVVDEPPLDGRVRDRRRAPARGRRARLPLARRAHGRDGRGGHAGAADRVGHDRGAPGARSRATVLIVVDLVRTGGLVVEVVGVAAAATAVGLLVLARAARGS